jgi:hypothetical protein
VRHGEYFLYQTYTPLKILLSLPITTTRPRTSGKAIA